MEILYEKLGQIPDLVISFAPKLILALAIFFIGKFILGKVMKAVHGGALKIPNIDKTLAGFFTSTIHFAGMVIISVAALTALSIPLGFLATVVTALVIALGFALQGALGDLASGILVILFRPYSIGDEVELNGTKGFVTDLSLFATRMKTGDNVEIIVANGDAFGNTITNYFAFGKRRLDMDFGVSYDADLDKSIAAILSSANGDERILQTPAPWAKVTNLGDSSVDIQLRVWCAPNDHRHIKMDIPYRVKKALDKAGIEIPYPHAVIIQRKT
ncbi:MAG: mechanosensitive ion channel family protein [Robiginitomaculum sp.]|nr:mechanosensitive ion channel family protein [Robiginitomaculum sp.]